MMRNVNIETMLTKKKKKKSAQSARGRLGKRQAGLTSSWWSSVSYCFPLLSLPPPVSLSFRLPDSVPVSPLPTI